MRFFCCCRERPSARDLLDHPWLSTKTHIPQTITTVQTETITIPTPKPIAQPKISKKTYSSDNINGSYAEPTVRTYASNCLCPQCGTTCRHLSHTPVTKTPITVDRGILC